MSRGSSFQTRLGLGNTIPGPYQEPMSLYDANRFKDRDSFVVAHSGDRAGGDLGRRNSVYATLPDRNTTRNFTNLSDQVEKEMGNCVPGRQDTAPAYGVPGNPNIFTSYPILSPFENRRKWTENFNVPFQPALPSKDNQMMGNKNQGGDLHSRHPVVPKQQPILLGSNLISDGIDQYYHRMTYLNRWFDEDDGEILIQTPKSMQNKYTGQYGDELFKTPIDNTENKISTGIMTNPWTGEMYETFENAMPPPNADKHIPKDRFEIANPKLLQMFGGLDPHAPLPKKKEICLSVPGSDHGNNVWGDQLYEEERRKRIIQEIGRELFNNRTGDSSTATAFAKEKPAGFVGLQPMYRALPYLPPVIDLDNHGYMPVTDYQAPESNMIKAEVSVRKPDLTTCPFQYAAGPLNDQPVEYVVTQYTNRPTNRGGGDQYYAGVPYWSNNNTVGPQQTQNKPTLKEFMEQPMTTGSQYNQTLSTGGNGYVVSQTQNKPTLKEFMEQPMTTGSQYNQTLSTGGNGYVVTQTQNKSTLKEFMEQAFDMGNFSDGGDNFTGGYIDFQGPVLETARAYYEYLPAVGRPANFSDGVGGDFVGNGIVTSRQNRGTDSLDWVTLSKVPQDAEDTSVTWIGVYDRDTKRELAPNIPMSDLAPSYESVAGRMFGALTPKCNLDLHQTQDEWLWSAGFAPQMPDVITG